MKTKIVIIRLQKNKFYFMHFYHIFQLIKLDSLAVYWNSNTEQLDGQDKAIILSKLTSGVADSEKDTGFQYCRLSY